MLLAIDCDERILVLDDMSSVPRLQEKVRIRRAVRSSLGCGRRRDGEVVDAGDARGDEAGLLARLRQPRENPWIGRILLADFNVYEEAAAGSSGCDDDTFAAEGCDCA